MIPPVSNGLLITIFSWSRTDQGLMLLLLATWLACFRTFCLCHTALRERATDHIAIGGLIRELLKPKIKPTKSAMDQEQHFPEPDHVRVSQFATLIAT